jgi:hypothetical protein
MFNLGDRIIYTDRKATVIECLDGNLWVVPDDNLEPGWRWSISDGGQCGLIKANWHWQLKNQQCELLEDQSVSYVLEKAFIEVAARHFLAKFNYQVDRYMEAGINYARWFFAKNDDRLIQVKVIILNEIYEAMVNRIGLLVDERLKFIETFINTDQYTEFRFEADQNSLNVTGNWTINNDRFIGLRGKPRRSGRGCRAQAHSAIY